MPGSTGGVYLLTVQFIVVACQRYVIDRTVGFNFFVNNVIVTSDYSCADIVVANQCADCGVAVYGDSFCNSVAHVCG